MDQSEQFTIAITLYDRRDYIFDAIRSVLSQPLPLQPLIIEDCGPDRELQQLVEAEFGSQIRYHRNPVRRGLFDNWNACLELCTTPYLSILHDDDWLTPWCVETWLRLLREAPDRSLYFGRCFIVDEDRRRRPPPPSTDLKLQAVDLQAAAVSSFFGFPGQLFLADAARRQGGFRASSQYCGDWEMWFKLALDGRAIQTQTVLGCSRHQVAWGRGTTRVHRVGRSYALTYVQTKRNLARLVRRGLLDQSKQSCDRSNPLPVLFLLEYGAAFSQRMLLYNKALLLRSQPPSNHYRVFQLLARVFGWRFVFVASHLFRLIPESWRITFAGTPKDEDSSN